MARPSKLTDAQWDGIQRRILAGEKPADLAREFKVHRSAVSRRVAQPVETIKAVADQVLTAERAVKALPVAQQVALTTLLDELRATSMHLAGAAKYGSATAHRLAGIAHAKVQEIDDAAPMTAESFDSLKHVAGLTRMANDASVIGLNLLAANKNQPLQPPEQIPSGLDHFYGGSGG